MRFIKTARIEIRKNMILDGPSYVKVYINNRFLGVSSRSYKETLLGLYSYHFKSIKLQFYED